MAYIQVEFAGKATSGGYLKIDGGKQIKLTDGKIIPIDAGVHHLSFSSQSGSARAASTATALGGNVAATYALERNSVDGEITIELDENDLMCFTVASDAKGHILSLPTYSVQELDEEEMQRAADIANKQKTASTRKKRLIAGIVLVLIALILIFDGGGDMTNVLGGIGIGLVGVLFLVLAFYKKKKQ